MSERTFLSAEEARREFQGALYHMMEQRPGVIGLESTASFSKFVGELSIELGGDPNSPINIERLRNAHKLMTGKGAMEELQIYPGFGDAIENGVERDFSQLENTTETGPEAGTTPML